MRGGAQRRRPRPAGPGRARRSVSAGSPFGLLGPGAAPRCAGIQRRRPARRAARDKLRARGSRSTSRRPTPAAVSEFLGELFGVPFPDDEPHAAARRAQRSAADGRSDAPRVGGLVARRVRGAAGAARARGSALGRPADGAARRRRAARRCASGRCSCSRWRGPRSHELFPRLWAERGVAGDPARRAERARRASGWSAQVLGETARRRRWSRASSSARPATRSILEELIRAAAGGQGRRGCPRPCSRWCRRASTRSTHRRAARAARGERVRRDVLARRRCRAVRPRARQPRGRRLPVAGGQRGADRARQREPVRQRGRSTRSATR